MICPMCGMFAVTTPFFLTTPSTWQAAFHRAGDAAISVAFRPFLPLPLHCPGILCHLGI